MNYATIKQVDIANGPGCRTSVFVSGCTRHCPGCFNAEAWDFDAGKPFDDEVIASMVESLRPSYVAGLTVLGGEPMEPRNQPAVCDLLARVKAELPEKSVWVYTGDVLQDLLPGGAHHVEGVTDRLLALIDVLVDGMFVQELHDVSLRFRGSSNQRILNLQATLSQGKPVLWEDEAVYRTHSFS